MKTFQVEFRYQDRKNGSEGSTVKLDASSPTRRHCQGHAYIHKGPG